MHDERPEQTTKASPGGGSFSNPIQERGQLADPGNGRKYRRRP
jgi:hypothetical protein